MELAEKTSYKRGATDFSSQVARMKAAGCDMVVLGTIIRETIGTIGESRKTGFNPVFLGSSAAYTDLIHKLGGKAMDGLYATMTAQHPYLDEASQPIRFWANKYKTKFNEDPTVFSVYGYTIDDLSPRRRRRPAQPEHRQLHQGHGHDDDPADIFGSAETTFTPDQARWATAAGKWWATTPPVAARWSSSRARCRASRCRCAPAAARTPGSRAK
jgi:branched-chain amino acid transport system substrate-binding protein